MPYMRIREAAEYLGVSDDTVRRWVERGLLTVSVDAGTYCVRVFDPGTMTAQTAFTVTIVRP